MLSQLVVDPESENREGRRPGCRLDDELRRLSASLPHTSTLVLAMHALQALGALAACASVVQAFAGTYPLVAFSDSRSVLVASPSSARGASVPAPPTVRPMHSRAFGTALSSTRSSPVASAALAVMRVLPRGGGLTHPPPPQTLHGQHSHTRARQQQCLVSKRALIPAARTHHLTLCADAASHPQAPPRVAPQLSPCKPRSNRRTAPAVLLPLPQRRRRGRALRPLVPHRHRRPWPLLPGPRPPPLGLARLGNPHRTRLRQRHHPPVCRRRTRRRKGPRQQAREALRKVRGPPRRDRGRGGAWARGDRGGYGQGP